MLILNLISLNKEILLEYWPIINKLPDQIYAHLDEDIEIIEKNIHKNVVGSLIHRYPRLKQFSIENFIEECTLIYEGFDKESTLFAKKIIIYQYDQFQYFEKLTTTPPRKLSEKDKIFRKRLKKGKSILIKEFGKKKSHQSIRKLFNSDAFLWIQILKPILLSNPNSLSESIPLKKELF